VLIEDQLSRINYLANKKKNEGLTEQESAEQKQLREAYVKAFRESFKNQLENTDFVYKD
jgi:uncharacterized protein YnzC (UPF0291/DUF896 family)